MNFEYLMDLSARNQFDEVRLIGRTIESQGRSYHFLAMTRVGEELYLYIMAQTEPWEERALPDDATMRQSMKSQFYMIGGAVNISKIEINDLLIESNGGQSYTMDIHTQCQINASRVDIPVREPDMCFSLLTQIPPRICVLSQVFDIPGLQTAFHALHIDQSMRYDSYNRPLPAACRLCP